MMVKSNLTVERVVSYQSSEMHKMVALPSVGQRRQREGNANLRQQIKKGVGPQALQTFFPAQESKKL